MRNDSVIHEYITIETRETEDPVVVAGPPDMAGGDWFPFAPSLEVCPSRDAGSGRVGTVIQVVLQCAIIALAMAIGFIWGGKIITDRAIARETQLIGQAVTREKHVIDQAVSEMTWRDLLIERMSVEVRRLRSENKWLNDQFRT